jgi:hypothetical protein
VIRGTFSVDRFRCWEELDILVDAEALRVPRVADAIDMSASRCRRDCEPGKEAGVGGGGAG